MEQKSLLMKALAAEHRKIFNALESIGYHTIKIDIIQGEKS